MAKKNLVKPPTNKSASAFAQKKVTPAPITFERHSKGGWSKK